MQIAPKERSTGWNDNATASLRLESINGAVKAFLLIALNLCQVTATLHSVFHLKIYVAPKVQTDRHPFYSFSSRMHVVSCVRTLLLIEDWSHTRARLIENSRARTNRVWTVLFLITRLSFSARCRVSELGVKNPTTILTSVYLFIGERVVRRNLLKRLL